jgi:hypothetical protein
MTFVFLSFGFVSNFGFRVSKFVRSWRPLPRGVKPWGSYSDFGEINTPRGESSFIQFPRSKFNGNGFARVVAVISVLDRV